MKNSRNLASVSSGSNCSYDRDYNTFLEVVVILSIDEADVLCKQVYSLLIQVHTKLYSLNKLLFYLSTRYFFLVSQFFLLNQPL